MAVRVQLDDQTSNQSKSHPRLPKTSQYKVLRAAVWLQFRCQIMPHPQFDPLPRLVVTVNLEDRNWYQCKCRPTFLFDFYTHIRPTLHRLVTIHNTPDIQTSGRQTERSEYATSAMPSNKMFCSICHRLAVI